MGKDPSCAPMSGSCLCYDKHTQERDGLKASEWWHLPTTDVPAPFRGIMWLPGNGDPGLLSFNTSHFDAARRRIKFKIYAPDAWYSTTKLSHSALCCGSYAVYGSEDATRADIRSTFDWPCCCGVESCRCIADFTMEQQAEDPNLWIRDSVLCQACCGRRCGERYTLTRVVDDRGQQTPHYAAMVAANGPAWTLTTRTPFPLYCGADASHHAATAAPGSVAPVER